MNGACIIYLIVMINGPKESLWYKETYMNDYKNRREAECFKPERVVLRLDHIDTMCSSYTLHEDYSQTKRTTYWSSGETQSNKQ